MLNKPRSVSRGSALAVLLLCTVPGFARENVPAESPTGFAVEQFEAGNEAAAIRFLIQLAYQGNVAAQFNLGIINLGRDDKVAGGREARFWFEKAASAGDVGAQFNLGMLLRSASDTGAPDTDESAKGPGGLQWLERAAEGGALQAQTNFGIILANSRPARRGIARRWLELAARRGDAAAVEALKLFARDAGDIPVASLLHPLDLQLRAEARRGASQITADRTSIYPSPSRDQNPVGTLSRGDAVEVLAKRDGWVQVGLRSGLPLWVRGEAVERSGDQAIVRRLEAALYVTPELRPDGYEVGAATRGESLRIIRDEAAWLLVEAPLRFAGWVRESEVGLQVSSQAVNNAAIDGGDEDPLITGSSGPEQVTGGESQTVRMDGMVLAAPDRSAAPLGLILKGDLVTVTRQQADFSYSEMMPRRGWIFGSLIDIRQLPAGDVSGAGAVNRSGTRVRLRPDLEAPVIDQLPQGQGLSISDSTAGWFQVVLLPVPGWIASALLGGSAEPTAAALTGAAAGTDDTSKRAYVSVERDTIVYSEATVTSTAYGRLLAETRIVNPTASAGRGLSMLAVPRDGDLYGWVSGTLVDRVAQTAENRSPGVILNDGVRIRLDPTTERDNVIGSFERGSEVQILGSEKGWLKVVLPPSAGFAVVAGEQEN